MLPTLSKKAIVATALLSAHAWTSANTFTIVLAGDVQQLGTSAFDSGGKHFDTGLLALSGIAAAFDVNQGDTIDATITLSHGPFTLPASPEQFFGFNLTNAALASPLFSTNPGATGVIDGSFDFALGGASVYVPNNANCGNCASLITFAAPGAAVSFDSITVHLSFNNLTAPYTIDSASISYQLSQPVPEPAAWGLMVAGLLGVAGATRRRTR